MAANARPWLIGCAIGCGLLVVLMGVIAVGSAFFVRDMVQRVEETRSASEDLDDRFGKVTDFRPAAHGHIDPLRIEAFLEARGLMEPVRTELEDDLGRLAAAEEDGLAASGESALGMLRSGVGLVQGVFTFNTARSRALLDAGIGPGEYLYIYDLAYYTFLGYSPADGPPFTLVSGSDDQTSGHDAFVIREERLTSIRRRLNRRMLPMLRNQLEDARSSGEDDAWQARLTAEVEAMENSRHRLPWQDGLPDFMAESLEPFREQLAASYSELCNPLETGTGP
jgi:hypothetical protein